MSEALDSQMDPSAGQAREPQRGALPRGCVSPLVTLVLAIVAGLGLIGTLVFGLAWNGLHTRSDAERGAQHVARSFLLALTNFDARTVDEDFTRIQSYATGDFATQARSFFGSDVRQAMEQVAASSRGQIRYLFTEDVHGRVADVFGVVDQTILNNKFKAPEADELRIDLTMRRVGGVWRVAEVTVLQAPPVAGSSLVGSAATPPTTASPSPPATGGK